MDHGEPYRPYLDAMREEWERLLEAAARRSHEGVDLSAWITGVVDAVDADRGVGMVESLGAGHPDEWREVLRDRLLREVLPHAEREKRARRHESRQPGSGDAGSLWYRDPEVHSGARCFSGTRVPVATVLDSLVAGRSLDEYLERYPSVTRWKAELYVRGLAARAKVPADLLDALRPHFTDVDQLGIWLIGANGWLSGDTPLEHLNEPDFVLEAARWWSEPLDF